MICIHCGTVWPRSLAEALSTGWGRLNRELGLCPSCSERFGFAVRWVA